jgi:hypothetical protein
MRFAAFIATLLITLPAQAWWDNDWGCRKKITISGTDATGVQGAHTDFPILFNTTDPNFGAGAQASGNDLAFVDSDDTSQLKHEVERWVNGTGEFIAWVKVPSLPDAGKDIYIYYCNDSVGAQEDPTNVWDSNFKGVWHMDTNVDSTTGPVTCTNNGVSFTSVKIGNGTTHDHAGSGDYFDCGADSKFNITGKVLTIEMWAKTLKTGQAQGFALAKGSTGAAPYYQYAGPRWSGGGVPYYSGDMDGSHGIFLFEDGHHWGDGLCLLLPQWYFDRNRHPSRREPYDSRHLGAVDWQEYLCQLREWLYARDARRNKDLQH